MSNSYLVIQHYYNDKAISLLMGCGVIVLMRFFLYSDECSILVT